MANIKLSGIIVVLAALAEMVAPYFLFADGFDGSPMGYAPYDVPNLAEPAGYAFSILVGDLPVRPVQCGHRGTPRASG